MCKSKLRLNYVVVALTVGLLCLWTAQAPAQTTEPPETEVTDPQPPDTGTTDPQPLEEVDGDETGTPSTANPPAYIDELVKASDLQQAQVDQMRTDGMGWGEIRIATRLAEQMAANSDGTLTFDDALAQVLAARAEGKGYGEIAGANNLKIGNLLKQDDKAPDGKAVAEEKKLGLFARIGRALGFGRSAEKVDKPAKTERIQQSAKAAKGDRPERPARLERVAKPEKIERPASVERPTRPERPERGPHR